MTKVSVNGFVTSGRAWRRQSKTELSAQFIAFVVRRTVFGRRLLAIGGNRPAVELAGVPVGRVLVTVYVISGTLA